MKLNAEQIKKALECHKSGKLVECERCPFDKEHLFNATCVQAMCENALFLINELTQENEQLSESYDHLEKTKDELLAERSRLTEENERLKDFTKKQFKSAWTVREDIVREMQERLKVRFKGGKCNLYTVYNIQRYIDQIAEEMIGEAK